MSREQLDGLPISFSVVCTDHLDLEACVRPVLQSNREAKSMDCADHLEHRVASAYNVLHGPPIWHAQ